MSGVALAIMALNGWMMAILFKSDIVVYLGGDQSVYIPAVILGAQGMSLGITTLATMALLLASRRGVSFRKAEPMRYGIEVVIFGMFIVLFLMAGYFVM